MVEGGQGNAQGAEVRLEGPTKDMRTEINGGSGKEGNYEVDVLRFSLVFIILEMNLIFTLILINLSH